MTNDNKSLAHTTWNCKYHIVLPQNTGEKYSTENTKQRSGKFCGNYATGKESV